MSVFFIVCPKFWIFAYKNLFHSSTIIKFSNCTQLCNCAYVLFLSNCSIETVNKLLSVELSLFVTVLVSHLSNRLIWFAGFHNCIKNGQIISKRWKNKSLGMSSTYCPSLLEVQLRPEFKLIFEINEEFVPWRPPDSKQDVQDRHKHRQFELFR